MHILAFKGARKFTASLLGSEIGVTGGAIFRHFKTMEGIVDAVVARIEDILFEDFPPQAADPIERLGVFSRRRIQVIVENPHVSRLLLSDHLAQAAGRTQAKRLAEFKQRSRNFVLGCLREARESGILPGGLGPEEGAVLVLGSIFALAHSGTGIPDKHNVERISQNVWSILESAFRGRRDFADFSPSLHRSARSSRPRSVTKGK